jgi:hypothetical protein
VLAIAGSGHARIEPGWVSPTYGVRLPAPVVVVTAEAADADLVTVVAPDPGGKLRRAGLTLRATTGGGDEDGTTVQVHRPDGLDTVWWGAACGWRRWP